MSKKKTKNRHVVELKNVDLSGFFDKPKPLTPQQRAEREFQRSVKDLATSELEYRVNENMRRTLEVQLRLAELEASAKVARADIKHLERERAAMQDVIDRRV